MHIIGGIMAQGSRMTMTIEKVYSEDPCLVQRHWDIMRLAIKNRIFLHKMAHIVLMHATGQTIDPCMNIDIETIIELI